MKEITKDLLHRVQESFPSLEWSDTELDDLVKPSFGIITGFPELLEGIDRLSHRDLGEIPPAGTLPAPGIS